MRLSAGYGKKATQPCAFDWCREPSSLARPVTRCFSSSVAGANSGYRFPARQTRQLAADAGAQEYLPEGESPAGSRCISSRTELILSVTKSAVGLQEPMATARRMGMMINKAALRFIDRYSPNAPGAPAMLDREVRSGGFWISRAMCRGSR